MNLIISDHAAKRMFERIGCNPSKNMKLALKAWRSTEPVSDRDIANKRYYEVEVYPDRDIVYRKLMGRIFIFDIKNYKKVILATVYPPTSPLGAKRPQVIGKPRPNHAKLMPDKSGT